MNTAGPCRYAVLTLLRLHLHPDQLQQATLEALPQTPGGSRRAPLCGAKDPAPLRDKAIQAGEGYVYIADCLLSGGGN